MERKEGRSFDDSDDEEFQQERIQMKSLLEKFENIEHVLENAALTSALLYYMFNKSQEYFSLLYVYVFRKYLRINDIKNSMRNYNHINMEVYTTFIHPKSILPIKYENKEIMKKIEDNIDSENCIIYLNKISEFLIREVLSKHLDQFRETIRLGLESYSYTNKLHDDMNRTKELKILESLHNTINTALVRTLKSRCLPPPNEEIKNSQIFGDFQIRATVLALNTQYEYFLYSKKYSYTLKHPENLIPVKTFLSSSSVKSSSRLRIKGHNFDEHSMPRVKLCLVCDVILWGPHPSCLYCQNCKRAIHRDCKVNLKNCILELKSTTKNEIIEMEVKRIKGNNAVKYTKSMNSTKDTKPFDNDLVSRSESARSRSPENLVILPHTRFQRRSTSEGSMLSNLVEPLPIETIETDEEMNVLETFEPDNEFKLFEKSLSKSCNSDKGEYQRLLVLMEFHHKTRFTRMSLKRIKYVLVDPWIKLDENLELFDSLSLNCIEKLYKLIGSLVDVIDACKGVSTYDTAMAQNVLNWLTDDDDYNLQRWLQLSTDLCCTNLLNSVKASWLEHKQTSSKLNDLFSVEINRILVIEQLSNMRSLLFNLPMIVTKIVKDLNRISIFKDEARIWEQVGHELSHLPQLIDERCIPVVHLINNGTIVNSSLKYKTQFTENEYNKDMEFFINNFPKTIFKNNFIDFQLVKISNLRESRQGEVKQMRSAAYVREEVDAAVISYQREVVILQKENDKYLLKQFKSPEAKKLFPVITLKQIHAIKQTMKENKNFPYELTILLIHQAIIAQIHFKSITSRDMWYDHVTKMASKFQIEMQSRLNSTPTFMERICPNTFDEISELNVKESHNFSSVSTPERMSIVKTSLYESMDQVISTFNVIANEVSPDGEQDNVLKRIFEEGPYSSGEFMLGFVNVLKEYVTLGYQMMDQSQSLDTRLLLQRDIMKNNMPKIKQITDKMAKLMQSQDQDSIGSASSEESIFEYQPQSSNTEKTDEIAAFIDDIINESLSKIDYNSTSVNKT